MRALFNAIAGNRTRTVRVYFDTGSLFDYHTRSVCEEEISCCEIVCVVVRCLITRIKMIDFL